MVRYETVTGPVPDRLIASGYPVLAKDVTVAAGEGQIQRGQLLGVIRASGKYGKYVAATKVTGENIGNTGGTPPTSYTLSTTNAPILPGSMKVTVGTTVFYDNGKGQLEAGTGAYGVVYYDKGRVELYFDTAPAANTDIVADYAYSTRSDGAHLPVAVAAEDVDATSADQTCTVYVAGHFRKDAVLPDVSTDTWVEDWLAQRGIYLE